MPYLKPYSNFTQIAVTFTWKDELWFVAEKIVVNSYQQITKDLLTDQANLMTKTESDDKTTDNSHFESS